MRRRTVFLAAFVALASTAAACTGDEPAPSSSASTSTEPTESPIATPDYTIKEFVPGEYQIATSGVVARLSMQDRSGTMTVRNGSTVDLGEAAIVLVLQTQEEATATLDGPPALKIGESGDYAVELPEGTTLDDVGLFRLTFDGVSLAVFGQVVAED